MKCNIKGFRIHQLRSRFTLDGSNLAELATLHTWQILCPSIQDFMLFHPIRVLLIYNQKPENLTNIKIFPAFPMVHPKTNLSTYLLNLNECKSFTYFFQNCRAFKQSFVIIYFMCLMILFRQKTCCELLTLINKNKYRLHPLMKNSNKVKFVKMYRNGSNSSIGIPAAMRYLTNSVEPSLLRNGKVGTKV